METTKKPDQKEVKELIVWDMPDTYNTPCGFDVERLPEATTDNMMVMINKINELVQQVNKLKQSKQL